MYERILVPVDGGAASERGATEGIRLARVSGASLCFVHVVDEGVVGQRTAGFSGTIEEFLELQATFDRAGRLVVERARRQARAAGVFCIAEVRRCAGGGLPHAIATQALGWHADVIVMGVGGNTDLRPGSESIGAHILRTAPVPVMQVLPRALACGNADERTPDIVAANDRAR